MDQILLEEYRGDTLECVHRGHICGVSYSGDVKYVVGDTNAVTFLRSAGKPFQAIPVLRHGADVHFELTGKETAIMMGSHRAEPFHVDALESMLRKIGVTEDGLVCHPTYPLSVYATEDLLRHQAPKRSIYHNCSGKHLGVLALCKMMGYPLETYYEPQHPAQLEILETLSYLSECPIDQIQLGTDGCGFPVFAIPLRNLATAFLKLACPELIEDAAIRTAVEKMVGLMNEHYEMVAGSDRICSSLLMDPNIVAKGGAKGVYCFGLKKEKLAFALKVLDGSEDEWPLIVASILEQIQYDNLNTIQSMYELAPIEIKNDNKKIIGRNTAVFTLHIHS
ncbi:asparaginase [Paenibacillus sp. CGMCC 1.16610]|uniref:Asparaginase n=1 Tax=Paenibacillus anseongense TaxID=2682845 RepID=A0ABW9U7Q0_9BACL|nr:MULTISPECIES: asparaginase [Paenibacillus]MBA2940294.1 asparaginase [Paenibacillus sp. CGMCC 1.16610]MVQ35471.1 asparaginase [Paenibacillus anseongense]